MSNQPLFIYLSILAATHTQKQDTKNTGERAHTAQATREPFRTVVLIVHRAETPQTLQIFGEKCRDCFYRIRIKRFGGSANEETLVD